MNFAEPNCFLIILMDGLTRMRHLDVTDLTPDILTLRTSWHWGHLGANY